MTLNRQVITSVTIIIRVGITGVADPVTVSIGLGLVSVVGAVVAVIAEAVCVDVTLAGIMH